LALYQHTTLTVPQIERLLFTLSTRSQSRHQRLLKLFPQNEYVKRIEQLQLRSEPCLTRTCWDDLGLSAVASCMGVRCMTWYPTTLIILRAKDAVDHWIATNAVSLIESVRRAVSWMIQGDVRPLDH